MMYNEMVERSVLHNQAVWEWGEWSLGPCSSSSSSGMLPYWSVSPSPSSLPACLPVLSACGYIEFVCDDSRGIVIEPAAACHLLAGVPSFIPTLSTLPTIEWIGQGEGGGRVAWLQCRNVFSCQWPRPFYRPPFPIIFGWLDVTTQMSLDGVVFCWGSKWRHSLPCRAVNTPLYGAVVLLGTTPTGYKLRIQLL